MSCRIVRGARGRRNLLAFTVITALVAEPFSALAQNNPPAAPAPQVPATTNETAAPAEQPAPAPSFTRDELRKLLAPIALYPDAELGSMTACGRPEKSSNEP